MIEIKNVKIFFKNSLYTVLKRKKKSKKPEYYMMDLNSKTYLSSLYPIGEDTYLFDDKVNNYKIQFYTDSTSPEVRYVIIKLKNKKTYEEVKSENNKGSFRDFEVKQEHSLEIHKTG